LDETLSSQLLSVLLIYDFVQKARNTVHLRAICMAPCDITIFFWTIRSFMDSTSSETSGDQPMTYANEMDGPTVPLSDRSQEEVIHGALSMLGLKGISVTTLVKRTLTEFMDDDMPTFAAGLAYQALFSLFPFLLFLLTLVSALHLPDFFAWLREQASLVLPNQAVDLVNPIIDQMQDQSSSFLSFGILLALWSASSGIRSIMNALNHAYDVEEQRSVVKRFSLSIVYTIGIAVLLLCAAGLMIIGPQVMGWLASQVGLEDYIVSLWTWLRWPVAILLMMMTVAMIYYVAPDVEQDFRFITPGSVLAVMIWIGASLGFGYYVSNFADYNAMYGSIGAIIVLLLYFYISGAVLLLGAEVNAVIEHHSTEGKDAGEKELP